MAKDSLKKSANATLYHTYYILMSILRNIILRVDFSPSLGDFSVAILNLCFYKIIRDVVQMRKSPGRDFILNLTNEQLLSNLSN